MAHLLEHMLFKGSLRYPNPSKSLKEHGAFSNASTWTDRTIYFEQMLATDENLEFALDLEADRMLRSHITDDALRTEMTVVRNEFEMRENDPTGLVMRGLLAKGYTWHPYRDATIGNRSDIERVPGERLRSFYRHHYRPSNAILFISGKFDVARTLGIIDARFASLSNPTEPLMGTWTEEPVQDGPRSLEIRREGSQTCIGVFYHTPAAAHPEATAIKMLQPLLSDVPWGRVHRRIEKEGIAANYSVITYGLAERGQVLVLLTLKEGQDPGESLVKLQGLMEGFASTPITDEEAERARASLISQIRATRYDELSFPYMLAEAAAAGDWRLWFIERDRIKKLSAADLQAAALKYLIPNNRTSALFVPTQAPVRAAIPPRPEVAPMVEHYKGTEAPSLGEAFDATPANIEARTVRSTLNEGIRLAVMPKKTAGATVKMVVMVHFNDERCLAGKSVVADLLAGMLLRSTAHRTYQQLSDELDGLRSVVFPSFRDNVLRLDISTERSSLAALIDIAADMVRNPAFLSSEFETVRSEMLAAAESQLQQPLPLAYNALLRAAAPWPSDSVHYLPTLQERVKLLKAASVRDVRNLYEEGVDASSVQIAVVGDADPDEAATWFRKAMDGWNSKTAHRRVEQPFLPPRSGKSLIATPDKPMATVGLGTAFPMADGDDDGPAMRLAVHIFGRGVQSRLVDRLRAREGLSYDCVANLRSDRIDPASTLVMYALCARENADRTAAAMKEEFNRWIESGVSETELNDAKKSLRLAILSTFGDDAYLAELMARGLYLNRTLTWEAESLDKLDALTVDRVNTVLKRRLSGVPIAEVWAGDLGEAPAPSSSSPQ